MIVAGLQRQSDCSLSLIQASYVFKAQGTPTLTVLPPTPHYEKVLAANAFLTKTPEQFTNGCVDPALGTTSNIWQFLGQGKDGETLLATVGSTGVITQGVNPDGSNYTLPTSQMTDVPPITSVAYALGGSARRNASARQVRVSGLGIGEWWPGGNNGGSRVPIKLPFAFALGVEFVALAGLWQKKRISRGHGGWGAAFAVVLLLTVATFAGGCSGSPGHSTRTAITVVGT